MTTENLPLDSFELQKALNYEYNDISLLNKALTHSSYSNELKLKHKERECNERLEFLGDSVLSIIVSEYLFSHYATRPEGELTRMRAEVVCEKALSKFANKIGLGNYLFLGHGEEKNNGRKRKSILADAFEAVLASMYLDAGKDGKKMVAMAENDTIPSVDNLTVENAGWLYFCPWYGEHLMSERYQDADNLKEIYNSDYCITLDELPADLYKLSDTDPTEPTKPSESTGSDVLYGDATLDGNVDIADAVAVASYVGDGAKNTLSAEALKNADVQAVGDGVTANDALAIQQYLANVVKELPV